MPGLLFLFVFFFVCVFIWFGFACFLKIITWVAANSEH